LKNKIEAAQFKPATNKRRLKINLALSPFFLFVFASSLIVISLWFVLTARSIIVVTFPPDAEVTLGSWLKISLGNNWLVRPGEQSFSIRAPGYKNLVYPYQVTDARIQKLQLSLTPLPGDLEVILSPQKTGELFIDNKFYGEVPGIVKNIPAGLSQARIEVDRYLDYETELQIQGRGILETLNIALIPGWTTLSLTSSPVGADLYVEGKHVGKTPQSYQVLQGVRQIQLRKEGYKTWNKEIAVTAGTPINMGAVPLAKADGSVIIKSAPPGATVSIGDNFYGKTPVEVNLPPTVKHTVSLMKEGYKDITQNIAVESAKVSSLSLTLEPEMSSVNIITVPKDAKMLIDGRFEGSANRNISLPTHPHEFTIFREGFATYRTFITPRKGVEKRYTIKLKTEEFAKREAEQKRQKDNREGYITTFSGQEMKLFNGGKVTLGTKENLKGRRPNEVVRDVILETPFYLSTKEVTNGQFREFLGNHNSGEFDGESLNQADQPVANVSWFESVLYCNWLSRRDGLEKFYLIKYGELLGVNMEANGYRLPTEAEWEFLSHPSNKGQQSTFPWGDDYPPPQKIGNFADKSNSNKMIKKLIDYNDSFAVASPVGSFQKNTNDLYDMGGNTAEWVHDFYEPQPPTVTSYNYLGPSNGRSRTVKGSSWMSSAYEELKSSYRTHSDSRRVDLGFRIARYAR
jgi:formylglycine-generating enzyme required for sulfatase activity